MHLLREDWGRHFFDTCCFKKKMANRSLAKKSTNKWAIDFTSRPRLLSEKSSHHTPELSSPLGYTPDPRFHHQVVVSLRSINEVKRESKNGFVTKSSIYFATGLQRCKQHTSFNEVTGFQQSSVIAQISKTLHKSKAAVLELQQLCYNQRCCGQKSWDIALGPFKQIPMNLFIMYMAGNSISIFPIMMVGMMFLRPVKALLAIKSTFTAIEGEHAVLQQFVYLLGNLLLVGLALYKCHSMGLLPTATSDWLAFMEYKQRLEYSGGGFIL